MTNMIPFILLFVGLCIFVIVIIVSITPKIEKQVIVMNDEHELKGGKVTIKHGPLVINVKNNTEGGPQ